MLLEGKNAVIYGGGGKVCGAVVHSKRVLRLGSWSGGRVPCVGTSRHFSTSHHLQPMMR